jgi:hypothetical protein
MADNWQLKAVLSASAAGLLKTLTSVDKATRGTRKHLADIGSGSVKLAQSLALPVGLLGGLAAGLSFAGIQQGVMNFAALGDEVAKGSQKVGLSIADYQQWLYVASQSGIEAGTLTSSMGRLNKGIAEAAAGKNQGLASLFARAGIAMRGANGEVRSTAELLPEIADLFARNGNAAVQARMGNAIFGKSWQELAPLLLGGSKGIEQLQRRYKELGLEVNESAIKSGEAFGDQVDDLNAVLRSYGNTITSKLLPALGPIMERTIEWAVANRELIATNVTRFVEDFLAAMSRIDWNAVATGIGSFIEGCKSLVDWLGGTRNALIALVLFMNASAIASVLALTGSFLKMAWSLGTLAVTAIPAAVASMGGMNAVMAATALNAGRLLGVMTKIGLVAGAGWAGWEVGKKLNEWVLDPAARLISGDKQGTLGTALYDAFNKDPMAQMNAQAAKPSLLGSQAKGRVDGQVNIKIDGLPQGSRVEQAGSGNMPINLDAGYRSYAVGMPL